MRTTIAVRLRERERRNSAAKFRNAYRGGRVKRWAQGVISFRNILPSRLILNQKFQLADWIVIPVVVGSSPISHPNEFKHLPHHTPVCYTFWKMRFQFLEDHRSMAHVRERATELQEPPRVHFFPVALKEPAVSQFPFLCRRIGQPVKHFADQYPLRRRRAK
jgi:hypothetical protein